MTHNRFGGLSVGLGVSSDLILTMKHERILVMAKWFLLFMLLTFLLFNSAPLFSATIPVDQWRVVDAFSGVPVQASNTCGKVNCDSGLCPFAGSPALPGGNCLDNSNDYPTPCNFWCDKMICRKVPQPGQGSCCGECTNLNYLCDSDCWVTCYECNG
jgi:hypothetical protein